MSKSAKKGREVFSFSLMSDQRDEFAAFLRRSLRADEQIKAERSAKRKPGRLKGRLIVDPAFFEPLSDEEVKELTGERGSSSIHMHFFGG